MSIPRTGGELTAAWLSAALGRRVTRCEVEQIGVDTGYASQVYRVRLESARPRSVIVKLAEANREPTFYARLASRCDDAVPACWYASEQGGRTVVVLEDLGDAVFGDSARGCTPAQAAAVIDRLASLHATWWHDGGLREVLPVFGGFAEQLDRVCARRAAFADRFGDSLSPEGHAVLDALGPQHVPIIARLGGPPSTLVHRDCHLDNIAFCARGPVIFDWQRACVGAPALDVALFVSGALPGVDRAAHEAGLIDRYHTGLVARGVAGYALERLRDDVRAAMLRCFIGTVNGLAGDAAVPKNTRQASLARPTVQRWGRIVADYELLDLVR